MRKKELLAMPKLRVTEEMLRTAMENPAVTHTRQRSTYYGTTYTETYKESKYGKYYRAAVQGETLKVAVYVQANIEKGLRLPVYEVYVNRKENRYLTYEPLTAKWRTAKISMLDFPDYSYLYYSGEWQQEADRKMVNKYFETGKNLSIGEAVLNFQMNVRQEDLRRKHKNECDQIDAIMREVPELPPDFENWVIRNCFAETIFYEPEKGHKRPKMYCTHCKEWMDVKRCSDRPEHGRKTVCPGCGTKAVFRSWNKQKVVEECIDVGILQRLIDGSGWILRSFACRLKRRREKGWENLEFSKVETTRVRLNEMFAEREFFEHGEYKYTGVYRWCHGCRQSNWGGYYGCYGYHRTFGMHYMYTPNLREELRDTAFASVDLETIFKGGQKVRVNPPFILQRLYLHPYVEYLQKSGLTVLVDEIMNAREKKNLFSSKKEKIHEVLCLDKQRFQRLKKINGGSEVLETLQYEQTSGEKITDQNIRYIMENDVEISKIIYLAGRTHMSVQRTLNYLERQQVITGQSHTAIRRHYEDYLELATKRGMDITDEIVCRQLHMMEYHDRYLEAENKKENTIRDIAVDNEFTMIREQYMQNRQHFDFETEDFVIWVPKKASDITREGRLQHHCVGASNNYLSKMNEGKSYILFLRRKADAKRPYYTLEVKWNGEICQYYAAYDRQPDKQIVETVLKEFRNTVTKRMLEEQGKTATLIPAAG